MDLINRSIEIVDKERSKKELKACHIHDLSHYAVVDC